MTLKEKLHAVYAAVDHIEKKGKNKSQNYDYIRAVDVARTIREELSRLRVYAEVNFEFVGAPYTIARAREKDAPFSAVNVRCSVVFHDLDSTDTLTGSGLGTGADTGDKAAYKGQTGALKYALKNAFLTPDESDPEADEKTDEGASQEPDFQSISRPTPAPSTRPIQAAPTSPSTEAAQPKASAPPAAAPSTSTATAPAAVPVAAGDDRLPTEKELADFRVKFGKLGDELSTDGKLKSSKSLPINRKLLVFLLQIEKAEKPEIVTKSQWEDFFVRATAAKANPEVGIVGLGVLIDRANGIEKKK